MTSAQMTSVSQALPGLGPAQPRQHPADGKEEGSNFGEMVHGAEKSARHGKQPAEPMSSDAHPARRALAGSPKAQPDQDGQDKTAAQRPATAKAAKNSAGADHAKAEGDAATQSSDAAPLQDGLPLLMALGDIRYFATSTNADRGGSVAEGEAGIQPSIGQGASSQLAIRQGKRQLTGASESSGPLPQSSRATMATEKSGPDFGQKPVSAGPVADSLVRNDDIVPGTQGTETDAATPQSWRPSAAQKTAQTAQSIASIRPSSAAGRMDVVSQQSFPAPAQNPLSQTASALVEAIASDNDVQQAFSSASLASQTANSVAVPTHILKIELHPAELGAVIASLRLSGEQLSIEMKPETHEAYRRLTADSDAIVKSLRGLGFEVDHVTILQPSMAAHSAGRADANSAPPMSTGRDQPSSQPGNSGGNGAGGDRQPGRNDGNGAQEFNRAASPLRERAGDDIFI